MKKLIDLSDDTVKKLKFKALEVGKDVKNYMQDELTKLANRKSGRNSPLEF